MHPKIFRLLQKHQSLDAQLRLEQQRPRPDSLRVRQLKKLKLAAKDALNALMTGRRPASA